MEPWFANAPWLGHPALSWAVPALGALLGYAVAQLAAIVLGARLQALARRRPDSAVGIAASVVKATRSWLLLLLAIAVAARFLELPSALDAHLGQWSYLLVGLQLALWATRFIVATLGHITRHEGGPRNPVMYGILKWTAQLVVWLVLLLAVLGNAGVNVNAFVASLGVGGVAVALAAQNVLGDLFASVSIGLDKPFEVGEFIAFGSEAGTVRRVGIKSTRILSLSGEELSIANAKLLGALVRNYSRMAERRVVFGLRVAIDTPRAKVERLVDEARRAIARIERVRFDRGHLVGFGDSALELEFVYYVLDPGFNVHADIRQQVGLCLIDLLERTQVRLAVPVRSLRGEAAAAGAAG